jgi:hypothetical protein
MEEFFCLMPSLESNESRELAQDDPFGLDRRKVLLLQGMHSSHLHLSSGTTVGAVVGYICGFERLEEAKKEDLPPHL